MDLLALPAGTPLGRSQAPGTGPRARHAGIGLGGTGAAATHRWACSPRSNTNVEPARPSPWHD